MNLLRAVFDYKFICIECGVNPSTKYEKVYADEKGVHSKRSFKCSSCELKTKWAVKGEDKIKRVPYIELHTRY